VWVWSWGWGWSGPGSAQGGGRAKNHYEEHGDCRDLGRERAGSVVFSDFFNVEHRVISFLPFECE